MALSYDTWLKGKELAEKLKSALGTAAEAGIEAALIEIPVVGWLLAQAVKGGIGYSIDEIVDMIPHEYPSGIGYKAGDTAALNQIFVKNGKEPMNLVSLTRAREQEAIEKSKMAVPATPYSPFISAPFGMGMRAAPITPRANMRAIRRATARQRRALIRPPAQNPYSPGAIVPARVQFRQVSGI